MNIFLKIQGEILEQLEINKFENNEPSSLKSFKPNNQGDYRHMPKRSNDYFNANKKIKVFVCSVRKFILFINAKDF